MIELTDGFERALWSAAPPILPVAPVMMIFMMIVQARDDDEIDAKLFLCYGFGLL